MNLGDPELELIDPTPNVHALFIQFDRTFFYARLASRAVVRWSKRMYSCAGVCSMQTVVITICRTSAGSLGASYEGRGGLCDIALSEPLLKLRPRKDLVETLLHEMIHAYLFITLRVQDRDGHGPNFKEHMNRINKAAGIHISIYHDFHDEVELYQTHWWRCSGPCQLRKPHFGIVRRSANTPPGPKEYWWAQHQMTCGGTFIKIKEPEKKNKNTPVTQPKGDITKYITSTKKTSIPPIRDSKIVQINGIKSSTAQVHTKSNNSSTVVVTQKGISNPINKPVVTPPSFVIGKYYTIGGTSTRVRSNSIDAAETVRSIWAKKQLTPSTVPPSAVDTVRNIWAKKQLTPSAVSPIAAMQEKNNKYKSPTVNVSPKTTAPDMKKNNAKKVTKHKTNSEHVDSPPAKIKKIDDYFKKNATSLLKDIYGANIQVESNNNNKLVAVNNTSTSRSPVSQVDCPICGLRIEERIINTHLDECLNKDLISKICSGNETAETSQVTTASIPFDNNKNPVNHLIVNKASKQVSKEILASLSPIPPYKPKLSSEKVESLSKENIDKLLNVIFNNEHEVIINEPHNLDDNINWDEHLKTRKPKIKADSVDVYKPESVVAKGEFDKYIRKSDNVIVPKEEKGGRGYQVIVEDANVKLPPVKKEPETASTSILKEQNCPCCGRKVTKPIDEHLDECLAFFDTSPEEASTSFASPTIVINDDEDDIFDESQVFNATGTKLPCPCCMQMVENEDMNAHLDSCLS